MFGIKNHVNNLQFSERFYYSNFQFYNDYDNPKQFANDISKITYSCRRKTAPVITKYCPHTPNIPDKRTIRHTTTRSRSGRKQQSLQQMQNQQFQQQEMTMQAFLQPFINTFQQSNYTQYPDNVLEGSKNLFKISYFPKDLYMQQKFALKSTIQQENLWSRKLESFQQLKKLLHIQKQMIQNIVEMNKHEKIQNENIDYYSFVLAFSELAHQLLFQQLRDYSNGMLTRFNLFMKLIQDRLGSIIYAVTFSHQILYIPRINSLSYFINPALCAVKSFLTKQEHYSKSQSNSNQFFHRQIPKIAFINLDGIQSPCNFQFLKNSFSQNLLYITIYKDFEDLNETFDQNSLYYSRFISELVNQCNNRKARFKQQKNHKNLFSNTNVWAFPLNSVYMRSKLTQQQINYMSGTSLQITFLFQNCIYEELRHFAPNIIFISYNGRLQIEQAHFNQILRNLTIIADHRIILFPNLTTLFFQHNYLKQCTQKMISEVSDQDDQYQQDQEAEQIMQEKRKARMIKIISEPQKLLSIAKFLEQNCNFQIHQININEFFNNLGMYNKISSGTYSFQRRRQVKAYEKFEVAYKYAYFNNLSSIQQFSYLQKYCLNQNIKGFSFLLSKQRDNLLKNNKEQVGFFSKFIDKAIEGFNSYQTNSKSQAQVPKDLKYKYKKFKHNYLTQQKEIGKYLQQKKKSILIQSITRTKIKKVFAFVSQHDKSYVHKQAYQQSEINFITEPKSKQFMKVRCFSMFMRNQQGQKQQIYLQNFSQVVVDPNSHIIFCLNYLDLQFRLCALYGYPRPEHCNSQKCEEVEMFMLKFQNLNEYNRIYFQYSTYFNQQNNILYLYWPYEWNPIEQAQHILLSSKYQPRLVNKIKIIKFDALNKLVPNFIDLNYRVDNNQIQVLPRYGSTMWGKSDSQFYVFGGYYDSKEDFMAKSSGVSFIKIFQNKQCTIKDIPKSILKNKMRPKANYIVKRIGDDKLVIKGGYGRQFTNFYNVYSYMRYIFDTNSNTLTVQKTKRHINSLQSPIENKKQGLFQVVNFQEGSPRSSKTKGSKNLYKFIYHGQNENNLITFNSNEYKISTHKKDTNAATLFQLNFRLRNIFTHTSYIPELYLLRKESSDLTRVQLLVKLHQNFEYAFSKLSDQQYIFPYEDSIISSCISRSGQSNYILAYSPIYTNQKYVIYEGNLGKIDSILEQKQIKMREYYQFNSNISSMMELGSKSIYEVQGTLYVIGGAPLENYIQAHSIEGCRYDCIIQCIRGIRTARIIKINHPQPQVLSMSNSFIVASRKDYLLLYAIENNRIQNEQMWQLKIQKLNILNMQAVSTLTTATIINNRMFEIKPQFKDPVFVSIQKYYIFNISLLQVQIQRLIHSIFNLGQQDRAFENDSQYMSQNFKPILQYSIEELLQKLDSVYELILRYCKVLSGSKNKYMEHGYLFKLTNEIVSSILTLKIQSVCLRFIEQPLSKELYRFYLQDKSYPLAKYIAIGQLESCSLVFFRLKFINNIFTDSKLPQQKQSTGSSRLYSQQTKSQNQYGNNMAEQLSNQHSKDQSNSQLKQEKGNAIYYRTMTQLSINQFIFSDEQFIKRYIKQEQQSIDIEQIEPFQPEVQQFFGTLQIFNLGTST